MDYRHLWLENGIFVYIWALLWSKSFASPVDYYPPCPRSLFVTVYYPRSLTETGLKNLANIFQDICLIQTGDLD